MVFIINKHQWGIKLFLCVLNFSQKNTYFTIVIIYNDVTCTSSYCVVQKKKKSLIMIVHTEKYCFIRILSYTYVGRNIPPGNDERLRLKYEENGCGDDVVAHANNRRILFGIFS